MSKHQKVKICKVCKVLLTPENSYYNPDTNLLCKTHKQEYRKNFKQDPEAINRASRKAYQNHREKWVARSKARYEVKIGNIKKPLECEECGQEKLLQGHHDDYDSPLEVRWLCSRCHADEHLKIKSQLINK